MDPHLTTSAVIIAVPGALTSCREFRHTSMQSSSHDNSHKPSPNRDTISGPDQGNLLQISTAVTGSAAGCWPAGGLGHSAQVRFGGWRCRERSRSVLYCCGVLGFVTRCADVYRYGRRRRQYLYGSTGLFSGKNHAIAARRSERGQDGLYQPEVGTVAVVGGRARSPEPSPARWSKSVKPLFPFFLLLKI